MPGPPPKSDSERRNRARPVHEWVEIPNTPRERPAPDLPDDQQWPAGTVDAWRRLWALPQASRWEQSGTTLHTWVRLHAKLVAGVRAPAPLAGEMRYIEDRHGVSPKAMRDLRWRFTEPEPEGDPKPKRAKPRDRRLRVVDRRGGAA